jgi:signal transduction histidine kinase
VIRQRSLRQRATFGIAAIAIIVVGAHSVAVYNAADTQEDGLMDQIASEELDHLIEQFRRDAAIPPPRSQVLTTYVVRDAAAHAALPAYLRELPDGFREIALPDGDVHVGVRSESGIRFYVVFDVSYNERRIRELGWLLLLGWAATAVVAIVLGYWVAGLVVRPVASLAEQVGRLGSNPPSRPLAIDHVEVEIARLARAFDDYLLKIAEIIRREQEFTSNVSHELRTPLTAIRTSCELLLQEAGLTESGRRRAEAINRAASRLTETARALLFLGRGADAPGAEEIPVRECIAEAAEPVLPILASKQVVWEIDIDPAAMVRADRTALYLVAGNLLRNAAAYTERGRVRAAYRDGRLLIEDSGPGIEAAVLPRIGERFNRGAQAPGHDGTGLGLAIVKRICERLGWQLEIESVAGRGTRASVRFPLPSSQDLHAASTRS